MQIIPMVAEDLDDPVVQSVFQRLRQRWGRVLDLYRVLGWSPTLVRAWAAFAWTLRFEVDASRGLRELLVVQIAGLLGAKYEYEHHRRMARAEGITEGQIQALPTWRTSDLFSKEEQAILALGEDLATKRGAEAQTVTDLVSIFSYRHAVEFIVTGSFYRGVAGLVNSLALEPEHDESLLPRDD